MSTEILLIAYYMLGLRSSDSFTKILFRIEQSEPSNITNGIYHETYHDTHSFVKVVTGACQLSFFDTFCLRHFSHLEYVTQLSVLNKKNC